jgi:hypothetical protein
MQKVREYIRGIIQECLNENIQLADKVYFKGGKLGKEDRDNILDITGGDNYTKIISDFYYYLKKQNLTLIEIIKEINVLYREVKNYDDKIFPIKNYDIYKSTDIQYIIRSFILRKEIITMIDKLPSIASRNMRDDIRRERNLMEFHTYFDDLGYFMGYYSLLGNRNEDIRLKIAKKMFKTNTTLDDLMDFVDDKEGFIGGVEFTKDDIKKMSQSEDFEIIYEQGDSMIVRVDSPEGIKAIGCNSLWCFTYGSGFDSAYRQWGQYSHNDIVYVLIDFREKSDSKDFMYVLISPLTDVDGNLISYDEKNEDSYPLFDMTNENYWNPYGVLKHLFGNKYKKIIKDYLNFQN